MLHYMPGCDVSKNHAKAVGKLERYMVEHDAKIDSCCRVKEKFLSPEDMIVNNCTMCAMILHETHGDNGCLSLYEFVLQDDDFPWVEHQGQTIVVQDCWRSRDNLAMQKAIRG